LNRGSGICDRLGFSLYKDLGLIITAEPLVVCESRTLFHPVVRLMRKEFSVYLDAIRFAASVSVVVTHFTFPQFIAGIPYQGAVGSLAVTMFFVLSGYVISYVAQEKEHTLQQYAISRMARIYSVAVPALALTLAVDFYLIAHGAGDTRPMYEYRGLWKYLPVFLLFGSEIAGFHAPVFGNDAFWTLSYEVWYYVAFGVFFYLRGWPRAAFTIAAVVILGPVPLLYFPIWILGALIYRAHQKIEIDHGFAHAGAILTAIGLISLWITGAYDAADSAASTALQGWPRDAMNFPSHYMAGTLAAAHIFFVRYCRLGFLTGQYTRKTIVHLASFTFAIYLSHRPAMDLWSYLIGHDPSSAASTIFLAVLVALSCWGFGFLSERQKDRWRSFFHWLLRKHWAVGAVKKAA